MRDESHATPDEVAALDEATADITADATPGERVDPALPDRLGRYRVLERLGAGAMGVVLAAYDPYLDRRVALKLLRPGEPGRSPARLLREAQALARLSHPNVVQIHDTGAIGDRVFLAMELVEGVDLRTWLAGKPRVADVLAVFLAAGRGLAAAHDAGLVHRDFKPDNVLVGADGRARVADFGLVRRHDDAPERPGTAVAPASARPLTVTGAQLGTPGYMSPEQHRGEQADARSDQYSYCVALWEALYGQRPFVGETAVDLGAAVLTGALPAPPRVAGVSRHLGVALTRGLARAPVQRFPDMHALLAALARDPARARRRWWLGLAGVGMLAGVAYASRGTATEVCTGGPAALAVGWDDERRSAVAAAIAGAPDPDLPPRVLAGLDAYASAWLAAHRDACLDHRRGEESSELLDARMRCLDRRRQALAAAAAVLTLASGDAPAPDAAQVVARLPPVSACADAAVVRSESQVPEDPATAAEVAALTETLIAARVRHDAGDLEGARVQIDGALTRARAAGFPPAIAEVLLASARLHFSAGAFETAGPVLDEALALALTARRDDLAAEAMARRLYVDGVQLGRPDEALRQAPLTLALAARAPEPHAAMGLAHNNIGAAQTMAHEHADAARSAAAAVRELRTAPRPDPFDLAGASLNLGMLTADPKVRRTELERAVTVYSDSLGPEHPVTLDHRVMAAGFLPDLPSARAYLEAACPAYVRVYGGLSEMCIICFHRLAHAAAFLADEVAARTAATAALTCRPGPVLEFRDQYQVAKSRAFLALLDGRPAEARETAERGLELLAPHRGLGWMAREHAELALLRGHALMHLGEFAEAAATLEGALPAFVAASDRPDLMAHLWLAETRARLAEALRALPTPDHARADELAAAADATLTRLGATLTR